MSGRKVEGGEFMEGIYVSDSEPKKKKRKKAKVKFILLAITIFLVGILINFVHCLKNDTEDYNMEERLYGSMMNKEDRMKAYNRAIALNDGKSANTCVYFIAEVLRMNGKKINDNICNTTEILGIMNKEGWKKERDYKKLKPGNICFTTDEKLDKNGTPTHTYIFMGWKEEGKYDYAYICDNQAKDYDGKIYHLRNILKTETVKGNSKEPFSFFIYK